VEARRRVAALIIVTLALAGAVVIVLTVAKAWYDWVVLGVILLTLYGASRALYSRRYPTKKRAVSRRSAD
jgi:uncharacterized membrane protein